MARALASGLRAGASAVRAVALRVGALRGTTSGAPAHLGATRSGNPGNCVSAIGARANWLTARHELHDGFGPGTPYARLVEAEADVLLLGAPLNTISLLHHAESIAEVPDKRRARYRAPLAVDGVSVWHEIEQLDVWRGPFPYEEVVGPGSGPPEAFDLIAREALAAGIGSQARVGTARCHLYPAPALVAFAVRWLESHFSEIV